MNLFEMVCELASLNELKAKPEKEWPNLSPFDIDRLRREAKRIPDEFIQEFLDGEEPNAINIATKYEAIYLHVFLDMVFTDSINILHS